MFSLIAEFCRRLGDWHSWDTWIVLTAAVAAMACALPGIWLVLRRNSMLGDALAHSALPGVVVSVLAIHWLRESGIISGAWGTAIEPLALVVGAVVAGLLTSVLTEWLQKLGQVEASAALGVVFTTLFALGLFLMRLFADQTHIDPDCVLFGQLELVVWDTLPIFGLGVPKALLANLAALAINAGLLWLCYKELKLSAFDPELATAQGLNARVMHYGLMAATATTVVMAYTTVGFILVIGLLIVPAATALLLTLRLDRMILLSVLLAAASALLGHVMAKTLPAMIFGRLGFTNVLDAGTSGMMAAAAGGIFVLAFLFAPQQGVAWKALARLRLALQIVGDDVLGELYRREELGLSSAIAINVDARSPATALRHWLAVQRLARKGLVEASGAALTLTASGRHRAQDLVRSHRLWESYMQKHFDVPDDHLHQTAHVVEHYIDRELQTRLADELNSPGKDPHGKSIPEARE